MSCVSSKKYCVGDPSALPTLLRRAGDPRNTSNPILGEAKSCRVTLVPCRLLHLFSRGHEARGLSSGGLMESEYLIWKVESPSEKQSPALRSESRLQSQRVREMAMHRKNEKGSGMSMATVKTA
ncbi:hypothetical protein PIB30_040602 [Stylosanthes scabra]|uniref:Uncharacterized protein n=1 Tax=Stylosanthes scabra TaxID=79078 RepID=A0ABU6RFD5_9FABA|nr:hypothetical protein [Stylosanthes scabra]